MEHRASLPGDSKMAREHVGSVAFFTTLAGYIHWKLSGEKVLGVGEASGMFPIDIDTKDFNSRMISQFDELVKDKNFSWKLADIMPKVLVSGDRAGALTEAGAKLLDVTEILQPGIPMCPPEGDAGTGIRWRQTAWHSAPATSQQELLCLRWRYWRRIYQNPMTSSIL